MNGNPTRRHRWRLWIADTFTLIVFFTATGAMNERLVAGMTWEQVVHARLLGIFLMVPVARPYGLWRDWPVRRGTGSASSRLMWESLALMTFQVPISAGIIAFSGAEGVGLLKGVIGAAVLMLVLGPPYGAFLTFTRRLFGLPRDVARSAAADH